MLRALGIAGMIIAMAVGPARAEDPYPTRPISMVVAFPPGGLADNTARPVATALERILKQPVAIINKAGAAGAVGNQTVATSKPDGYTLLMALVSISVLPEVDKLFGRPPNYTRDQFTGIARINADPSMLVVRADAPWQTVKEPEVVTSHAKLDTPIAYMDADEFNAWWAKDAARLAEVVKKIGKVESAQ